MTANHSTKIALISDTHMPQRWPSLPPAVFDLFAGVDLLFHAGDVGELWVLDQLSRIAPVIAVHGNDDTAEAQRELPYQQLITVAGQRILLWHSHYPDRAEEMASRRGEDFAPRLAHLANRAKRAGASMTVFGHWHIPFVRHYDGVLIINPGAIASGNPISRQLRQTVALLTIGKDGRSSVTHFDLFQPDKPYTPVIDWAAGFQVALDQFSGSMLAPALAADYPALRDQMIALDPDRFWAALHRVAHRCWDGRQALITRADLIKEFDGQVKNLPYEENSYD
jgi:putative phosphoesterase